MGVEECFHFHTNILCYCKTFLFFPKDLQVHQTHNKQNMVTPKRNHLFSSMALHKPTLTKAFDSKENAREGPISENFLI